MRKRLLFGALILATGVSLIGWRISSRLSSDTFWEARATPPEPASLCPWRDPEADLKSFFPDATGYQTETRILSGRRTELAARLKRVPTGEENALRVNRVYNNQAPLGTILIRRVKGEYGAIELVLAVGTNQVVKGTTLQRLREPQPIADVLQDAAWQQGFVGKCANDQWQIGRDLPEVPAIASHSAEAVAEGARDLLILLTTADPSKTLNLAEIHRH